MPETNYPKDDENTIYLEHCGECVRLSEILERAQEKWPGVQPNQIIIDAEHRHVTCLGYDLYDPTDYQNYIVVMKID